MGQNICDFVLCGRSLLITNCKILTDGIKKPAK